MPTTKISKKEILNEIESVNPIFYLDVFAFLKQLQSKKKINTSSKQALNNLFSLEGCLSELKMDSVSLQKKIGDVWSQKYETH